MRIVLSIILISLISLGTSQVNAQSAGGDKTIAVIPQPQSLEEREGSFKITSSTLVYFDKGSPKLKTIATDLSKILSERVSGRIRVTSKASDLTKSNVIQVSLAPTDEHGKEGYSLEVASNQIIIKASEPNGAFYGVQTLTQLFPVDLNKTISLLEIPSVRIVDEPRFEWRGSMLDAGRAYTPVEFVKKYLDYLAMHKLNVFHWHLTEDHGWRIEIKKHPKLTEIGAWRKGTQVGYNPMVVDSTMKGGFYTQKEIREIIDYAPERFITVIPEIEMPGHSMAALVVYPELSCSGGPFEMPLEWGIRKDIFCAGNEATFAFLEDVLTEVADLFPSPIIHIGGDEAPKDRWKVCEKCQRRIKEEGLKDEHELQSYFIKRVENFLLTKNKKIIGWDEILEGGLAPNAAVMSWRGIEGGIAAAKQHHDVVMAPTDFMYFDYIQGERKLEPIAIGHGYISLGKVYSYEPVPSELNTVEAKFIKGVQGNVWSEFVHTPEHTEYMAMPRLAALSEVAWTSPDLKNWETFKWKMEFQYQRYDQMGINYSKSAYNVTPIIKIDKEKGKANIILKTDSYAPEIYYTLDGSEPTNKSLKYEDEIEVSTSVTLKAANIPSGTQRGKIIEKTIKINQ